jgi:hypothetical protein
MSSFGESRTEAVGERRAQKQENEKMSNGIAGALVVGQSVSQKSMQREKKSGATIA